MRAKFNLLYQTTRASFKVRNASTFLGFFWYLLGPLLTFIILLLVFSKRLGMNIEYYPVYLLSGLIMWNFFSAGTSRAMTSVFMQANLIKSLPVNREIIVLSSVCDVFISHLFEIVVLFTVAAYFGLLSTVLFFFPVVLVLNFLFTLGIGYMLSALFFVFRDLGQIWSIVTKVWWFATPIFYAMNEDGPGQILNRFNPMYHVVNISRDMLIYSAVPGSGSVGALVLAGIFSLAAGLFLFKKLSPYFAEYV